MLVYSVIRCLIRILKKQKRGFKKIAYDKSKKHLTTIKSFETQKYEIYMCNLIFNCLQHT